jgi:hypothetical protein
MRSIPLKKRNVSCTTVSFARLCKAKPTLFTLLDLQSREDNLGRWRAEQAREVPTLGAFMEGE